MKVISWNSLLESSEITLFQCEKCRSKTFTPIQAISFRQVNNMIKGDSPIQYMKCSSCETIYVIVP